MRPFLVFCSLLIACAALGQNGTIKVKKTEEVKDLPVLDTTTSGPQTAHYIRPAFYYGWLMTPMYSEVSESVSPDRGFIPSPLPLYGIDLNYAVTISCSSSGYGSVFGYTMSHPQKVVLSDSLEANFTVHRMHVVNFYVALINLRWMDLAISPGFEYGHARLAFNASGEKYRYKNPFFVLHPSAQLRVRIGNKGAVVLGARAGYLKDIGKAGWRNKDDGNFTLPGVDQSGYYIMGMMSLLL